MAPKWMPLMRQCETLVLAQQNAAKFWILSVDIACWQRNYTCNKWTPVLLNKGSHMGFYFFFGKNIELSDKYSDFFAWLWVYIQTLQKTFEMQP